MNKKNEKKTIEDSSYPCPVVFTGPSGVGKGTLIEMLMKQFPSNQFGFSVSHTTRSPREGETDGVHYNFTSVNKMKNEIDEGRFIEYAEVHGNYYGTRLVFLTMIVLLFIIGDMLCYIYLKLKCGLLT